MNAEGRLIKKSLPPGVSLSVSWIGTADQPADDPSRQATLNPEKLERALRHVDQTLDNMVAKGKTTSNPELQSPPWQLGWL